MQFGQMTIGKPGRSLGLSNNQLKIIAMIAMACDHVCKVLLPRQIWLSMIGRIAFPIFAYMIAEGCRHTRHRVRYFVNIFSLAFACQLVYSLMMRSLYMSVLVTFSISILVIYAIDFFLKNKSICSFALMLTAFAGTFILAKGFTLWFPQLDVSLDYGIYGVMFPVVIYYLPSVPWKLVGAALMLLIKVCISGGLHWCGFLSIPLLALYNGKRGKHKLKYLFYIFYPLHLVLIYLLYILFKLF